VPWRVAINEGVELAKKFGGTDGHKYINGVLDKLAQTCARWKSRMREKRLKAQDSGIGLRPGTSAARSKNLAP